MLVFLVVLCYVALVRCEIKRNETEWAEGFVGKLKTLDGACYVKVESDGSVKCVSSSNDGDLVVVYLHNSARRYVTLRLLEKPLFFISGFALGDETRTRRLLTTSSLTGLGAELIFYMSYNSDQTKWKMRLRYLNMTNQYLNGQPTTCLTGLTPDPEKYDNLTFQACRGYDQENTQFWQLETTPTSYPYDILPHGQYHFVQGTESGKSLHLQSNGLIAQAKVEKKKIELKPPRKGSDKRNFRIAKKADVFLSSLCLSSAPGNARNVKAHTRDCGNKIFSMLWEARPISTSSRLWLIRDLKYRKYLCLNGGGSVVVQEAWSSDCLLTIGEKYTFHPGAGVALFIVFWVIIIVLFLGTAVGTFVGYSVMVEKMLDGSVSADRDYFWVFVGPATAGLWTILLLALPGGVSVGLLYGLGGLYWSTGCNVLVGILVCCVLGVIIWVVVWWFVVIKTWGVERWDKDWAGGVWREGVLGGEVWGIVRTEWSDLWSAIGDRLGEGVQWIREKVGRGGASLYDIPPQPKVEPKEEVKVEVKEEMNPDFAQWQKKEEVKVEVNPDFAEWQSEEKKEKEESESEDEKEEKEKEEMMVPDAFGGHGEEEMGDVKVGEVEIGMVPMDGIVPTEDESSETTQPPQKWVNQMRNPT